MQVKEYKFHIKKTTRYLDYPCSLFRSTECKTKFGYLSNSYWNTKYNVRYDDFFLNNKFLRFISYSKNAHTIIQSYETRERKCFDIPMFNSFTVTLVSAIYKSQAKLIINPIGVLQLSVYTTPSVIGSCSNLTRRSLNILYR